MSTIQVNNIQRVDGTESFAVDSDGSVTFAAGIDVGGTVTVDGVTTVNGANLFVNNNVPTVRVTDTDLTNTYSEFRNVSGNAQIITRSNTANGIFSVWANDGSNFTQRLRIENNGDLAIYADDGTTKGVVWDASTERLGIGTTSPAVKLQVVSNSDTDYNPATAALNTILSLNNGTSGTLNNALISFATETNGEWYIGGVQNSSNDASDFIFTSRDSGTRAERMRISSNGRVGIGTDSPSGTLNLSNSSGSVVQYFDSSNGQSTIYFRNTSSTLKGQIESQNDGTMWITTRASAPIQFGINNSERMRIDSSGNLLVGTTTFNNNAESLAVNSLVVNQDTGKFLIHSSEQPLELARTAGDSNTRDHIQFWREGNRVGTIKTNGSSTSYETSSDYRLKENVVDMTDAIDRVKQLNPSRFNFISDPDTTVDGFLAHEAQAVVPEAVTGIKDEVDDDGNPIMQGIDQAKLVPLLTAALKEAIARIEQNETTIADLTARIETLEGN